MITEYRLNMIKRSIVNEKELFNNDFDIFVNAPIKNPVNSTVTNFPECETNSSNSVA